MKVNNLMRRILILLIFVFTSCAKEEMEHLPTSYDENYFIKCLCSSGWNLYKMELLTDTGWKYQPIPFKGEPCQRDNLWKFYKDTCYQEFGYNCCLLNNDEYIKPIKYIWKINPDSMLSITSCLGSTRFPDKKIVRITHDSLVWLQEWYIRQNGELKVTKMKMTHCHL